MRQEARERGSTAHQKSKKNTAPHQLVVSVQESGAMSSAMLNNEDLAEGRQNVAVNAENQSKQYYNTVACSTEDMQVPASMEPHHPNMSSRPVVNVKGNAKYYEKSDGYSIAQVTYWRT